MNTLSLLGTTKSSMNSDKNTSVSSRSFSVKKKISPSLNESGTCIAVGSEIDIPSFSKIDFIISILSCLSSSTKMDLQPLKLSVDMLQMLLLE
jgi:hypothetical protein